MLVIFFILDISGQDTTDIPLPEKLKQIDVIGTIFLIPSVVCLLLALQWGGQTYPVSAQLSPLKNAGTKCFVF